MNVCPYCGAEFTVVSATGRPRRFCTAAHRKLAWREIDRAENELAELDHRIALDTARRNMVMVGAHANRKDALLARIAELCGAPTGAGAQS